MKINIKLPIKTNNKFVWFTKITFKCITISHYVHVNSLCLSLCVVVIQNILLPIFNKIELYLHIFLLKKCRETKKNNINFSVSVIFYRLK